MDVVEVAEAESKLGGGTTVSEAGEVTGTLGMLEQKYCDGGESHRHGQERSNMQVLDSMAEQDVNVWEG